MTSDNSDPVVLYQFKLSRSERLMFKQAALLAGVPMQDWVLTQLRAAVAMPTDPDVATLQGRVQVIERTRSKARPDFPSLAPPEPQDDTDSLMEFYEASPTAIAGLPEL